MTESMRSGRTYAALLLVGLTLLIAAVLVPGGGRASVRPAAPVEVQLEAWAGQTLRFRCEFTSGSNCGTHLIDAGATENLRYEVAGTDHNIDCTSTPWDFSWWPNESHDYTAQIGPPTIWTVDCWGDVGGATKTVSLATNPPPPPPPPPPPQPLTDVYGNNGEPIEQHWQDPSGNVWTVNRYANRYVVWTAGRGTYVIGRLVSGTQIPGNPGHYMGPGYVGQFSPREGPVNKLVANDPLYLDEGDPPSPTPRDGLHGGLGCFAVDLFREGTGGVDLNCRKHWTAGSLGGVDVVDDVNAVSIDPDQLGVTIAIRTHYRDSVGPVFWVTYQHRFRSTFVTTNYEWESDASDPNLYIKEPRIVADLGTSDVPIYFGQGQYRDQPPNCDPPRPDGTNGAGTGLWGLTPTLTRINDNYHHWDMKDVVPWCSTITIGPGAVEQGRGYHRGGFSFDIAGVPRYLSVEDPGYNHDYDSYPNFTDTLNFNGWRRDADLAPSRPNYRTPCGKNPPRQALCRMGIGEGYSANAWEASRRPFQYGLSLAIEAWRASVGIDDYWGRARALPNAGTTYSEWLKFY